METKRYVLIPVSRLATNLKPDEHDGKEEQTRQLQFVHDKCGTWLDMKLRWHYLSSFRFAVLGSSHMTHLGQYFTICDIQ